MITSIDNDYQLDLIMKRPTICATVLQTEAISQHMQRITLQAQAFHDFPAECESGYIKLLFTDQGDTDLSKLSQARPLMRTYTIRQFCPAQHSLSLDMVKHGTTGLASRWAQTVQVGDTIEVVGPGLVKDLVTPAPWYFMAADMTALPALTVKLSRLPSDARGYAVIKVKDKDDILPLTINSQVQVIWLTADESLPATVFAQPWLAGEPSVWVACEFDDMRAMRRYFRNDKQVSKERIYISSYWKQGVTEDGHKVLKQQDAQQQDPHN